MMEEYGELKSILCRGSAGLTIVPNVAIETGPTRSPVMNHFITFGLYVILFSV